jgi:hypothetical protein
LTKFKILGRDNVVYDGTMEDLGLRGRFYVSLFIVGNDPFISAMPQQFDEDGKDITSATDRYREDEQELTDHGYIPETRKPIE